jgi:hypothetical protein
VELPCATSILKAVVVVSFDVLVKRVLDRPKRGSDSFPMQRKGRVDFRISTRLVLGLIASV